MSGCSRLCIFALVTWVLRSATAFSNPFPIVPAVTLSISHIFENSFHPTTTLSTLSYSTSTTSTTSTQISQIQFVVLLLFGSGPVISGWGALPQVRNELDRYKLLEGGSTLGGPSLSLSPLQAAFIPTTESLRKNDVVQCIQVCPRATDFPSPKLANPTATCAGKAEDLNKFVSQEIFVSTLVEKKGYKCNPMAAESLWQAISGGSSSFVSVERLNRRIEDYRLAMDVGAGEYDRVESSRLDLFKRDLGDAKMMKIRSIATLLMLMGGTASLILATGLRGFL